jgi:two-component system, cell cycle response regulator
VGDAVLRHVADICRDEMHGFDLLARIGGEEFVLLLPHTTGEQAVALAERLRQRLETAPFVVNVSVTASIGVAATDAQVECIGDLMKRADQALYQAKRDGRNRVRLARAMPRRVDEAATVAA